MKKTFLLLFFIFMISSFAFAESFWCLNATQNIDTTVVNTGGTSWYNPPNYKYKKDAYRFNYSTVFDLSTSFSGTPKYSDYAGIDRTTGQPDGKPLNESRAIGTVGVEGCSHAITYTIDTNGGTFVSQSDPSKFRKFYVVNVPDYSVYGSTNRSYLCHNAQGLNADAKSTYNGTSMTFIAPITDGQTSTTIYDSNGNQTSVSCGSVGLDLFLCMEDPSSELTHLAQSDDYIATITVHWACSEGCPEHTGSFDMVVRGFYGNNSGEERDSFLLIVNPAPDATTLDLKQMIKDNQTKTIASMTIATTTKEGTNGSAYPWRDHIYAFLSSSANYAVPDYTGFVLTKMTNRSITIPYTLTVYNTTNGVPSQGQVYDGTDYFIENDWSYCIDLRDLSKPNTDFYAMSHDRYNTYYYAINYSGEVKINLSNFTIPGTTVDLRTVMGDPALYNSEYSRYIGKYESNIYYHIVFSD